MVSHASEQSEGHRSCPHGKEALLKNPITFHYHASTSYNTKHITKIKFAPAQPAGHRSYPYGREVSLIPNHFPLPCIYFIQHQPHNHNQICITTCRSQVLSYPMSKSLHQYCINFHYHASTSSRHQD
ncbi:hypothetical protein KP509_31G015100 [Ceratopteris richardii]|uniref:Uncharacterized protein n=1 Tax=Ceratopteris richardii TaxID=49495 RepID=A0A8T2QXG2_CERRI|nr:hypothetical protein KP509_31G015100 [Ceratopteris richardii]